MVFSSSVFMFLFLPITLVVYLMVYGLSYLLNKKNNIETNIMIGTEVCNVWLLMTSLLFYAWGEPIYVFLMLGSIIINYLVGRLIDYGEKKGIGGVFLASGLVVDVLILILFKYMAFLIGNINVIFHSDISVPEIALPIGISFYTFQEMSYLIDLYRKKIYVQKNLLHLSLYVAMFPQLIAGPIVRYIDIEEEIKNRKITMNDIANGIGRFSTGLIKKVLVADRISALADIAFSMNADGNLPMALSWLGMIAYTLQIYFDFSGYSDMAIGLGRIMGFKFNENFTLPYCSCSVKEFWRRWHISLSTWFRDYVYIPLGGSRCGIYRSDLNLLVVFCLTGLWHGASWNFVVWGLYHAVFLVIERYISRFMKEREYKENVIPKSLKWVLTMLVIAVGWMFFRAESLGTAVIYISKLLNIHDVRLLFSLSWLDREIIFSLMLGVLLCIPYSESLKKSKAWGVMIKILKPLGFALACVYVLSASYSPFLYFRF